MAAQPHKRREHARVEVEAVQDAASVRHALAAQNLERVVVGLAHVQGHGQPRLVGKPQLRGEDLALHLAGAEVVVVVEAYLA